MLPQHSPTSLQPASCTKRPLPRKWKEESEVPAIKRLPAEIDRIFTSKKLKTNYLSGKSASEQSFKQLFTSSPPNQKPEILHIATHGFSVNESG
jgi:hypothetical protein